MSAGINLPPDSEVVPSSLSDVSSLKETTRLDPLALGSGVRQFRLSLTSWIDQEDGFSEDDFTYFITSYLHYYNTNIKALSPINDNKSSTSISDSASTSIIVSTDRYHQLTKACRTALILFKVLDLLWKQTHSFDQILLIHRNVKRLARIYKPYNIFPCSDDHPISRIPEIQAVASALRNTTGLEWLGSYKNNDDEDILNKLQAMFGFQVLDDDSLDSVIDKLFENYKKRCKYLGIRNNLRLLHQALIINTEARKTLVVDPLTTSSNACAFESPSRFTLLGAVDEVVTEPSSSLSLTRGGREIKLPTKYQDMDWKTEEIQPLSCKLYPAITPSSYLVMMASELYEMMEKRIHEEIRDPIRAKYCAEDEAFLKKVVTPIYQTIAKEAERGRGGNHSEWRNYDDLNEYFWSNECFTLGWPMKTTTHPFFFVPGAKKVNFVEMRSFLHLFRSFDRMWNFYFMSLQAMIIIAWKESEGALHAIFQSFQSILSIFITYAALECAKAILDVCMSWKAAHSMPDVKRNNIVTAVYAAIWATLFPVTYFSSKSYFTVAILIYLSLRIPYLKLMKCQPRLYVGRGMHENAASFLKYMMFWTALLILKFTFSYYAEIKPLVGPTKEMIELKISDHRLPDLFPPALVFTLWSPVILVYFMDTQIWYAVLSTLVGGFIGFLIRLGEVQTLETLKYRFQFLPGLSNDGLVPVGELDASQNVKKAQLCQMWNKIITSFREEDLINNREKELMLVPYWKELVAEEDKELAPIRWPIFLLADKIPIALELAKTSINELTVRLDADIYMASAIKECYTSFRFLLKNLVDQPRDVEVLNRIFTVIEDHIQQALSQVNKSLMNLAFTLQQLSRMDDSSKVSHILRDMLESVKTKMMKGDLERVLIPHDSFQTLHLPVDTRKQDWEKNIKRLHTLFTLKDLAKVVPSNMEARRRLTFFANSLFMGMPKAPKVISMLPFSALTPYYSEDVLLSNSVLQKQHKDGISTLFYLQTILPGSTFLSVSPQFLLFILSFCYLRTFDSNSDEWKNFMERVGCGSEKELLKRKDLDEKLRLWASYKGQTLTRTVRGMMYYRKALELQAFFDLANSEELMKGYEALKSSKSGKTLRDKCELLAGMKFTYVVSCQQYGIHKNSKDPRATDIMRLMATYPSLRVAYVDVVDQQQEDTTFKKIYYSALVRANPADTEKDEIKLPGPPIIGEGKPENQNQAIIFTTGDALQTIDMNQDNYLEEAFKIRNLLQEFLEKHKDVRSPTILGLREHIFTGSVSSLAWFISNQENSFVTLGQRVLASPLKVRFHYGHPDVFDRVFHLTRGGFNSILREGNITHHEYIQVGKGREVGLNQISMFEAKIANGSGEQTLSRDLYRLGNQFDFLHMMSCYFTTVGFYFCSMLTVLTVYVFLYGRLYLVLSGLEKEMWNHSDVRDSKALQTALLSQSAVQIGLLMVLPMIMVIGLEKGFQSALSDFMF
uniref:1,3-beta-glucan synthase n=1 Tax=Brassica oleracea var. oleracea TaxID=109376 RepID=A0A0D3BTE1_BRAOL